MIRKNKSITSQLRDMEIGESMTINARAGISVETLRGTAKRLRKEGYDYTVSIDGLPKGACKVTRIEPRPLVERAKPTAKPVSDAQIIVLKAVPGKVVSSRKEVATTFEVDYLEDGTPQHMSMPVTYDQYKWWRKRNEISEEMANTYLAKLI